MDRNLQSDGSMHISFPISIYNDLGQHGNSIHASVGIASWRQDHCMLQFKLYLSAWKHWDQVNRIESSSNDTHLREKQKGSKQNHRHEESPTL